MKLSERAARIEASATLEVVRRAAVLRAEGQVLADFGAGEPDFASPTAATAAACRALEEGFTRYTPAAGIPALREALARRYAERYGAPWSGAEVVVTVGAKAALFELFLALLDPDDEVVVPMPCWVSFPQQIRFAEGRFKGVPMSSGDGFRIRAEPLLEAFTERTRAVLVNSPCNPTGGVVEAADLERLAAACAERGALLIADETYERFLYDGRRHASAAALAARYPETVAVVGSFSKTYAMTGWRVGYLLAPGEAVRAVTRIQSHATSNVTSFAMSGALAALREGEEEVERMLEEYGARRELVLARLAAMPGVECAPPAGAFYVFPDVSAHYGPGRQGSVGFARDLLERARVVVVPGLPFGDDNHVRLSFACSRSVLEEGLARMAALLGG